MPKSFFASPHDTHEPHLVEGNYASKGPALDQEVIDGLVWLDAMAAPENKFLQNDDIHILGAAFMDAIPTVGT